MDLHSPIESVIPYEDYKAELIALQKQLVQLQNGVQEKGLRIAVVFEGRDCAGKGGVIKRMTEWLDPKGFRVVAKGKPTAEDEAKWYLQRWIDELPKKGEIVFFDRSWYTRAVTESVMGYASKKEVKTFLKGVNNFEEFLKVQGDIILIKYWLDITQETQEERFKERASNPLKQWKLSDNDLKARELWDKYTIAIERMFNASHTELHPWNIVDNNDRYVGRLNCIQHFLSRFNFKNNNCKPIELKKIKKSKAKGFTKFNGLKVKGKYGHSKKQSVPKV